MKKQKLYRRFTKYSSRLTLAAVALFIAGSSLTPLFIGKASAAQLTSRSVTISTGQSAATSVTYTYAFLPSALAISSIKFVACTTATSTYGFASTGSTTGCTAPTSMNINGGAQVGSLTIGNGWTNTGAFSIQASTLGNCTPANNVLCIKRTAGSAETAISHILSWNGQTNPTYATSTSFYIGIYLYSDASFATPTDSGTVASAVIPALTIQAQVAEILVFCVGTTSVDDATTAVGSASSCSGSTVDLGTLDPTAINYSFTNGNNLNGVAILRTNAINGSAVFYDAIQDTGTAHLGALRIPGSNCTTVPGSCITSQGTSQGTFTAGTQKFGMTVAGTNCGTETAGGYYACVYSGGSEHLVPQSPYVGRTGNYCSPSNCNGNNGFAWDETGTAGKIAQASSNNVVADEALILKFAATPSITNTFGAYQVKADFTAVPTF